MKRIALFAAVGAALTYFLDPRNGRRRRAVTKDWTVARLRRAWRRLGGAGSSAAAQTTGLARKATHLREEEKPRPSDATLAQKVESEVFRAPERPKGQVSVNAENGVVYLRGEVESTDLIRELDDAVRKVQGVRDVENLLRVPGAPAPQKD